MPASHTAACAEQCTAISQEYLDEVFSFPKHHLTLSHTSPPLSLDILLHDLHAVQFFTSIAQINCLKGFSKPLFPWGYLCSLCWHLSYTNSRLHCCCYCSSLRNNFTLRICFFFSPDCLTVMHEEVLWEVLASSLSPLTQPLLLALSQLTEDRTGAEDFALVTALSLWYSALSGIIEPYFPMVTSRLSFNFLVNNYSIFCLDGYIHEV